MVMISAVAADAGVSVLRPGLDYHSADGVLISSFGRRPRIEFQVKATSRDIVRGDGLRLPVSVRNYDELRLESLVPRILIATLMPVESEPWLSQNDDELSLHGSIYWVSLVGMPAVSNVVTVTVLIPTANVFDRTQLEAMMSRAEAGSPL